MVWRCRYCGRDDFLTQRGWSQHLNNNVVCARRRAADLSHERTNNRDDSDLSSLDDDSLAQGNQEDESSSGYSPAEDDYPNMLRTNSSASSDDFEETEPVAAETRQELFRMVNEMRQFGRNIGLHNNDIDEGEDGINQDEDDYFAPSDDSVDPQPLDQREVNQRQQNVDGLWDDFWPLGLSSSEEEAKSEEEDDGEQPVNSKLMEEWDAFTNPRRFVAPLQPKEVSGVRLLHALREKKAPLAAYEKIFSWHLKENGFINEFNTLKDAAKKDIFMGRNALLDRLAPRHNLEGKEPMVKKIRLPSSKEVVEIPYHRFEDCLMQLLTDPRIKDDDYAFFNNDPMEPPPPDLDYVSNTNTADAHTDSHERLVDGEEGKQLMGVIWYLDSAVTGHFAALPVLVLKFSLSIFTRQARQKEHCWAKLAYLPEVQKNEGRAKKLLAESHHMEARDVEIFQGEGEDTDNEDDSQGSVADDDSSADNFPPIKAQDFHSMLDAVLESYLEVEKSGFMWKHFYRGRQFPPIQYVVRTSYVKVDTDEADVLCGKFKSRGRNVKHVCRNCHCPMDEADNILRTYRCKTQTEIEKLVNNNEVERLRAMSQHCMKNAWHKVRFLQAKNRPKRGIHGGSPCEKLHQFDLGVLPTTRTEFFEQVGESSEVAKDIDGLAIVYGMKLQHQSDRTMPSTNFGKGIKEGKLMARQYKGVLLILGSVLRSTMGRKLLSPKKNFKTAEERADWLMLVETLLQWDAYLGEPKMLRKHVKRLRRKHKIIMYLLLKVVKRKKGMGLKTNKFHAILHMMDDILLYGVPMEMDTGANESHHKASKRAARTTQRNRRTFNLQVARRLFQDLVIDLAIEEIENGIGNWEYYGRYDPYGSFDSSSSSSDFPRQDDSIDSQVSKPMAEAVAPSPELESDQDGQETDLTLPDVDQMPPNVDQTSASGSSDDLEIITDGARIRVYREPNGEEAFDFLSRSKTADKAKLDNELISFLIGLQDELVDCLDHNELQVYTRHKRGQDIWRAHPNFRGTGPWNDWVMVDWAGYGVRPAHVKCFVVLSGEDIDQQRVEYGGILVKEGTHAVVESAEYLEDSDYFDEKELGSTRKMSRKKISAWKDKKRTEGKVERIHSELFVPIKKEVGLIEDQEVKERIYYLADTEAFVDTCTVVPDIGGPPNMYFFVRPRSQWSNLFTEWLEQPHKYDEKLDELDPELTD